MLVLALEDNVWKKHLWIRMATWSFTVMNDELHPITEGTVHVHVFDIWHN